LCDKINRISALAFGLSFNFVGYSLIYFVGDPTQPLIYIAAVIIAISEQSPFVVLGVLNLCVFVLALALKSRIKAPEDA
jgi:hypothetical protein